MVVKRETILLIIVFATFSLFCCEKSGLDNLENTSGRNLQVIESKPPVEKSVNDDVAELPETFTAFSYFDVVEFRNSLVVFGTRTAADGSLISNEVYDSQDGINWKHSGTNVLGQPRLFPMMTVQNKEKLLVIGGSFPDKKKTNSVFETDDLKIWIQSSLPVPYEERVGGMADNLNGIPVVLGGMGQSMKKLRDVWVLKDGRWVQLGAETPFNPFPYRNTWSAAHNEILQYNYRKQMLYVSQNLSEWREVLISFPAFNKAHPEVLNIAILENKGVYYLMFSPGLSEIDEQLFINYINTDVVYKSADLRHWELLSEKKDTTYSRNENFGIMPYNGLPAHFGHIFLYFKENFWVIGRRGDVWRSRDCREWEQVAGPEIVFSQENH